LDLPIGHIDEQWTLPIGASARLDAAARTLTIEEAAVR
jgi:muramoyltetrapeptide carboxypeptidase LdcA involved in peptidoglycan recycling